MLQPRIRKPANLLEWFSTYWFQFFLLIYGLWVILPFLAPVFMHLGWDGSGRALYFLYSFFCHQLPERSFFFFGPKSMYSLTEIQTVWRDTNNPFVLRAFTGSDAMGWKVAWSDRMISFYTSVWIFAVVWFLLLRHIRPLKWWGFMLLLLPIALDGGTHMLSDLSGIGLGFRDTNQWLALWTGNSLPVAFYAGDALGSFNSWMRLVTGLLAGAGIAWFIFPILAQTMTLDQELKDLTLKTISGNDMDIKL
jgi:uncharacterized membrane protein